MSESLTEARERVKKQVNVRLWCRDNLEQTRDGASVCPECARRNHEQAVTSSKLVVQEHSFKCFRCGSGGDIYDLLVLKDPSYQGDGLSQINAIARWAHLKGCNGEDYRRVTSFEGVESGEGPKVHPTHENADKILFIASTKHEAALVRELGYKADVPEADNYLNYVIGLKDSGLCLMPMLNEHGNREIMDSCEANDVPCRVVPPKAVAYALEADGDELKARLSEILHVECQRYAEAMEWSTGRRLRTFGILPAWDLAMDVLLGDFVRESIPTGISAIDEAIDGVPRGGVTTIGAISSAGKTTLCVNMADNLARRGMPVLFATLEQDRHELAIMSMCRIIGQDGYDYQRKEPLVFADNTHPKGYRYINRSLVQSGPDAWTNEIAQRVSLAASEYSAFAGKYIHYLQTDEPPTVGHIRAAAKEVMKAHDGQSPIVIIDYLQLLAHENPRRDERLAVNDNMSALRRLARDLETAVIVISALNRASLKQGVTLSAFRESGGIEYASDMVLGLQPASMTDAINGLADNKEELTASSVNKLVDDFRDCAVKECDVRVLKNRAGDVPKDGLRCYLDGRCSFFFSDAQIREYKSRT